MLDLLLTYEKCVQVSGFKHRLYYFHRVMKRISNGIHDRNMIRKAKLEVLEMIWMNVANKFRATLSKERNMRMWKISEAID